VVLPYDSVDQVTSGVLVEAAASSKAVISSSFPHAVEHAEELIARAVTGQGIERGQLSIHADRGTSMTSKRVAEMLADLGVGRTHSRPHVCDNPVLRDLLRELQEAPQGDLAYVSGDFPVR